jgi:hypothetical protein
MPIHNAMAELSFGSRIEVSRWRSEYALMLAEVAR